MRRRDRNDELLNALKVVAPGTPLRDGLESILKAKTGGLIVIADSEEVLDLVDGGFNINKEYSPSYIYELAKMDGAIIISRDIRRILIANALLIPDSSIPTKETGTRHKTAERIARQTGELIISISERRNVITIYKGIYKYVLMDTSRILARANQALQTFEKYKLVLNDSMNNLSILEFEDIVTLNDVAIAIQRTEMVLRIAEEIERYIVELGNEGILVSMQLGELLGNTEEDGLLVIKDYIMEADTRTIDEIYTQIKDCTQDELLDLNFICRTLGFTNINNPLDLCVYPRGYRVINKIPRVPMPIIENLVEKFDNFQSILRATIDELDDVEGIGEVRAKIIKEGMRRLEDQLFIDNKHM